MSSQSIASAMVDESEDDILSLTLSAVPYNAPFGFARFPEQFRYSWYFTLFQIPFLPELWLSKLGGLRWLWNSWSPTLTVGASDPFWRSIVATFKQEGVAGDVSYFEIYCHRY